MMMICIFHWPWLEWKREMSPNRFSKRVPDPDKLWGRLCSFLSCWTRADSIVVVTREACVVSKMHLLFWEKDQKKNDQKEKSCHSLSESKGWMNHVHGVCRSLPSVKTPDDVDALLCKNCKDFDSSLIFIMIHFSIPFFIIFLLVFHLLVHPLLHPLLTSLSMFLFWIDFPFERFIFTFLRQEKASLRSKNSPCKDDEEMRWASSSLESSCDGKIILAEEYTKTLIFKFHLNQSHSVLTLDWEHILLLYSAYCSASSFRDASLKVLLHCTFPSFLVSREAKSNSFDWDQSCNQI